MTEPTKANEPESQEEEQKDTSSTQSLLTICSPFQLPSAR